MNNDRHKVYLNSINQIQSATLAIEIFTLDCLVTQLDNQTKLFNSEAAHNQISSL